MIKRHNYCQQRILIICSFFCLCSAISAAPEVESKKSDVKYVVVESACGRDGNDTAKLKRVLDAYGCNVSILGEDRLSDLSMMNTDVLVLNGCENVRPDSYLAIQRLLNEGADMIMFGHPPKGDWVFASKSGLSTLSSLLKKQHPADVLLDWSSCTIPNGKLTSALPGVGDVEPKTNPFSIVQDPKGRNSVLRFYQKSLEADYAITFKKNGFIKGSSSNVITFDVRGTADGYVDIELKNSVGSTWFTQLRLQSEWRKCVFLESDFAEATSDFVPATNKKCKISEVNEICIRFAGFYRYDESKPYYFEISNIAVAQMPAEVNVPLPELAAEFPLGPDSSFLSCSTPHEGICRIMPTEQSIQLAKLPSKFISVTRRPRALGVEGQSIGRWISWASVIDSNDGLMAGSIASSWIKHPSKNQMAVYSYIGVRPSEIDEKTLSALVKPIITLEKERLLVVRAGMQKFHYEPNEPLYFGALLANRNTVDCEARLQASLFSSGGNSTLAKVEKEVNVGRSSEMQVLEPFALREVLPDGDYRVSIRVYNKKDILLDLIEHRFSVKRLTQPSASEIVTVKNGGFELAGRPWQAHGLSYFMPYVAGQPNMNQWLPFLNPELYDPDIVDSDLSRIAKLGMTAVVIPYADLVQADSISDMLIRCQRYGIKVIMFIGYGVADPLNYNLELLERKIKIASLDRQPALLAIEPAWEPHFGARDERKKFDALWTKWVIEQYGSLQSAFKSWGFSPIVNGDTIEGPSDQQLIQVGPSQVMVAAYRRFTDDFVSRNYGMITRTIRKLCPHSLIGTRTGWGSSCSLWIDSRMPFDMISGAAHLDYISPEAYGLLYGPWSRVEDGKLVTALARYDGHGKPIVWMEYGQTIVDIFRGVWKQDSLNYFTQDKFVRNILRLMKEVQASGSFAWWWPGGYRIEEKSDFGFTEPFGSPRPALRTLSSMIPELMSQKGEYKTQKDIIIDRDMHPRGASMIIERHRKEFLDLDHQGIHAGFCTEGTNKNTGNVLLVGIGNVPFQKGMPPKYINAEFVKVEVMLQDNSWHEIQRDQKVSGVPLKHPIELRITALNTDDVAWDARQDSDGLVKLRVQCSEKNISETPVVKEIRWGQVCTMSMSLSEPYRSGLFTLRFGCNRVGGFGETFHFELN